MREPGFVYPHLLDRGREGGNVSLISSSIALPPQGTAPLPLPIAGIVFSSSFSPFCSFVFYAYPGVLRCGSGFDISFFINSFLCFHSFVLSFFSRGGGKAV